MYQITKHFFDLPKLTAEEFELSKNSNHRESTVLENWNDDEENKKNQRGHYER